MDGQQQIKRQPATGGTFARFNMRAFIFNSFYYFYHGIRSDRFWLFFSATPVLTYLLLKTGLPVIAAATAAVLAVRIIAATGRKRISAKRNTNSLVFRFPHQSAAFFRRHL